MSHEFRTPLSVISSYVYLMTRQDDAQRRQQKADLINLQISQVARLVDMLLLTSKLEQPRPILHSIDLRTMVGALLVEMNGRWGDVHQVISDFDPELPQVMGNEYLAEGLRQILENAYRYTPKDRIIQVKLSQEEAHVCLEVCDSGPGISSEVVEDIFKAFWRQDSARSTPGLGLGLTIAHKIIAQHGGTIQVRSESGEGSCFRVLLPKKPPQP